MSNFINELLNSFTISNFWTALLIVVPLVVLFFIFSFAYNKIQTYLGYRTSCADEGRKASWKEYRSL